MNKLDNQTKFKTIQTLMGYLGSFRICLQPTPLSTVHTEHHVGINWKVSPVCITKMNAATEHH